MTKPPQLLTEPEVRLLFEQDLHDQMREAGIGGSPYVARLKTNDAVYARHDIQAAWIYFRRGFLRGVGAQPAKLDAELTSRVVQILITQHGKAHRESEAEFAMGAIKSGHLARGRMMGLTEAVAIVKRALEDATFLDRLNVPA